MGLSSIATNLMIDCPIVKDRTGLMIAYRRSHADPFIKHFSNKNKAENFEEAQVIIISIFDKPHSIVLNGFYRFKKGLWVYANFKFSSETTQTVYTTDSNSPY